MIVFRCAECHELIDIQEHETAELILEKLDIHARECDAGTCSFDCVTELTAQSAESVRVALRDPRLADKIRRYQ
jgi:hypothetical protein